MLENNVVFWVSYLGIVVFIRYKSISEIDCEMTILTLETHFDVFFDLIGKLKVVNHWLISILKHSFLFLTHCEFNLRDLGGVIFCTYEIYQRECWLNIPIDIDIVVSHQCRTRIADINWIFHLLWINTAPYWPFFKI